MLDLKKYNINKDDTMLCGVSGGPDSMFLLTSLVSEGYKPIVCHVNYHKRQSALRDEKIVEEYCLKNNLIFCKKDCKNYIGNFQEFAREFRYNFFFEIYENYNAKCLLIAHHLDDKLETYIYRKNRNSKASSLCILPEEFIYNMRLIRPLLNISKKEIVEYCVSHSISFGIDESNMTNHYTRNKIRNDYLSSLSDEEKNALINKMNKEEEEWQNQRSRALKIIENDGFKLSRFSILSQEEKNIVLCELMRNTCLNKSKNISSGFLNEIVKTLQADKNHCFIEIEKGIYFEKDGDFAKLTFTDQNEFEYIIDSFEDKRCPYLANSGAKMFGIHVENEDFPLTIRSPRQNDCIELKEGHKTVSRLFVDKKIPLLERKVYPILLNKDEKIILIPGLYRSQKRKELNNNLFMIK